MVVAKVKEMEADSGFNAATDTYENLIEAGVIDPTKVVRFAIQNAASIAGLMLTTEAVVAEIPEKKSAAGRCRPAAGWTTTEPSRPITLGARSPHPPAFARPVSRRVHRAPSGNTASQGRSGFGPGTTFHVIPA